MTGGKASRQKGDRFEREVVRTLQDAGLSAERVPLSGSAGGSFAGDITFPALMSDWRAECKCRANGFALVYSALDGNDVVFLKQDRQEPLVVVPLHRFARLLLAAEKGKAA
jgi:Holliday junction resolvase